MKDLVAGIAVVVVFCLLVFFGAKALNLAPHQTYDSNIVKLTWDGCQYLRFAGNEQTLIHKSNCTNAVHWKELERR